MSMDSPSSSSSQVSAPPTFLSVECVKSGRWMAADKPQTGDIVEEIRLGDTIVISEFDKGRTGLQKILADSFRRKETRIRVRVRRGSNELAEMYGFIVPGSGSGWKKQYVLRGVDDPNHAVGFVDRTESECLRLQEARISRVVNALERTELEDGYVLYPWEKRMRDILLIPNSSSFYSILFLPRTSDKAASRYNNLEDTLARANAWVITAQASGVPVLFTNIQTESLLTKISGESASPTVNSGSLSEMSKVANVSLYGFEDYHGMDIGVVRAVRLWFSPQAGEVPVEIRVQETDRKLGFAISRTEEGFIYISSMAEEDDVPSARSGINKLFKQACQASRLLVISRISNQKVLPWMVSSTGTIRCFDTVSLSHKLSLHRHAKAKILVHVFLWDRSLDLVNVDNSTSEVDSTRENRNRYQGREAESGTIQWHERSEQQENPPEERRPGSSWPRRWRESPPWDGGSAGCPEVPEEHRVADQEAAVPEVGQGDSSGFQDRSPVSELGRGGSFRRLRRRTSWVCLMKPICALFMPRGSRSCRKISSWLGGLWARELEVHCNI